MDASTLQEFIIILVKYYIDYNLTLYRVLIDCLLIGFVDSTLTFLLDLCIWCSYYPLKILPCIQLYGIVDNVPRLLFNNTYGLSLCKGKNFSMQRNWELHYLSKW